METKAVDIVKPPATDSLERWMRWLNSVQVRLTPLDIKRKKIKVDYKPTQKVIKCTS